MRFPRFTTRSLMLVVAVVAILIASELMRRRWDYCRKHAIYCRQVAAGFRGIHDGQIRGNYRFRVTHDGPDVATTPESQVAWAVYYERLGLSYDRVARRPWLSIPADPPFPE
jgi:hypothetical protein